MPISLTNGRRHAVVIGLGNPLMGDDGLGLAALARLRAAWRVPSDVELVDGGTWGMNLLPVIEDAGRLLLIDAIDIGGAPGDEVLIPRERLRGRFGMKLSPHQVDLSDVLALAAWRGTLPAYALAIGLQPERLELSTELSTVLQNRLDALVDRAVGILADWGYVCAPIALANA